MADSPLSGLSSAGAYSDADLLYIVQGGTSYKTTWAALRAAVAAAVEYPEVANYAALPAAASHTGEIYVVLASQGSGWLFTLKDSGFYYSNGSTWTRLGALPADYWTDSVLYISDNSDPTKVCKFELGGITSGNTRTLTVPDASGTIVLLDATQTLTNKTLTSPTLTTPALGTPASGTLTNCSGLPASGLAAGTLAANVTLGEDTGQILLDAALSADGKWSGICEAGTAGATLAFGDLCYFSVTDSRWELADADADATAGAVKLGICVLAAAGDGSATTMLLWGKVRADAAFPALTVGAPVYVSTTAGDVQTAQPSGTDDVIRIIGYGNTADELFFCPSNDYMTHT